MWKFKSVFLLLILFPLSVFAWNIKSYDTEIILRKDASINVSEKITVDFRNEYHHGIYRLIPYVYKKKGTTFKVRIKDISVKDKDGNKIRYKITKRGRYLNVRIGNPSKTVTGIQFYKITYDVQRAIMFTDQHSVFYWNIIGTEWYVPIMHASAIIYLPSEIKKDSLIYNVTAGGYGAEKNGITVDSLYDGQLIINTTKMLEPSEGITIYMKLPESSVTPPTKMQEAIWFLEDNWIFLIPVVVFIFMFILWYKNGRNPEFKEYSIAVRYKPPDDLTAAEAGTLIDEKCDAQDVNSILIDLARRGFIRIEEIVTKKLLFMKNIDYKITLLKKYDKEKLESYELKFLDALFSYGSKESVLLSSLKNSFYMDYKEIKNRIYKSLVKKHMFTANPEKVRGKYVIWGIIIMFVPFFLLFFLFIINISIYLIPILILSGLIVMGFGMVMPKKTKKGVIKTIEIMGYKEYLLRVEKDELKEKLKENPNLFDEILPYALSLGIADVVATKFLELISEPPNWYVASTSGAFTTTMFMSSLGNAMHSFNTTFASAPSSSGGGSGGGGGFSGGGFGGGGGGAW